MSVTVNGKEIHLSRDMTVTECLAHLDLPENIAVFLNKRQLLYSEYETTKLKHKDVLRTYEPLVGG